MAFVRTLIAFAAAGLLRSTVTAVSVDNVIAVFGAGATNLTASSVKLPQFTFTVVTNSTHAFVTLNATSTKPAKVGWMGTGQGTTMENSDYLIVWPNIGSKGAVTWTLSHRESPDTEDPEIASNKPGLTSADFYTLVPALTTSSSASAYASVSYLRLLNMPSNYPSTSKYTDYTRAATNFIYASSSVQPVQAADNAQLVMHDQAHDTVKIDLSKAFTLPVVAASTTSSGRADSTSTSTAARGSQTSSAGGDAIPSSGDSGSSAADKAASHRDSVVLAHAVFGCLALLVFAPLAILVGRYLRAQPYWFRLHAVLQVLAAVFLVASFALAFSLSNTHRFIGYHGKIALTLLVLMLFQVALGAGAHMVPVRKPSPGARVPTLANQSRVRTLHIVVGVSIVVLGWAEVRLGFALWNKVMTATSAAIGTSLVVWFWILISVEFVAYVVGFAREARRSRRAAEDPKRASQQEMRAYPVRTGYETYETKPMY